MRVSFIIATYNSAATIGRCLDSLAAQDFLDFEAIIVDNKSTDSTLEIASSFDNKMSMKVISEPDRGIYDAWNKALQIISGDWIVFLGSDDFLASHTVLSQMSKHLNNDVQLVYAQIFIFDAKRDKVLYKTGKKWEMTKRNLPKGEMYPHTGAFHSKKLFEMYGKFDDSYKISGDFEFALRFFANCTGKFINDLQFLHMTTGGVSASIANIKIRFLEDSRAIKSHTRNIFPTYLYTLGIRNFLSSYILSLVGEKNFEILKTLKRNLFYGK